MEGMDEIETGKENRLIKNKLLKEKGSRESKQEKKNDKKILNR